MDGIALALELLDALKGPTLHALRGKALADPSVVKFLKRMGVDKLADSFGSIYAYAIVESATRGLSDVEIDLLKDDDIIGAIKEFSAHGNHALLKTKTQNIIKRTAVGDAFREAGADAAHTLTMFVSIFESTAQLAASPAAQLLLRHGDKQAEYLGRLEAGQHDLMDQLAQLVAAQKSVPFSYLQDILARMGESGVPSEEVRQRLDEKADQYLVLLEEVRRMHAQSGTNAVGARAVELYERGDLHGARELLREGRRQAQQTRREAARKKREHEALHDAASLSTEADLCCLQIDYREGALLFEEAANLVEFDDEERAHYLEKQAQALFVQGVEFGDSDALSQAAAIIGECLSLRPRVRVPLKWARTLNNLGNALVELGKREGGTTRLRQAVDVYRESLEERTRTGVPGSWAVTMSNLACALLELGKRESSSARLHQAVDAFRGSLEVRVPDSGQRDWALTQLNLASALLELGARDSANHFLHDAVDAYESALTVLTRTTAPLAWAIATTNLANAQSLLGQREGSISHLQKAVDAYRAALEVMTRERAPLQWAMTQTNLGVPLTLLGKVRGDLHLIHAAVEAYREALQELTRDRSPLDWALALNNLGNALAYWGEREASVEYLRSAVDAYRESLKERTPEQAPLDWAMTQNNLGIALSRLAALERDISSFQQAIEAHRAALREYTREHTPLEWARARHELGRALGHASELRRSAKQLEEAFDSYRAAIIVFRDLLGDSHPSTQLAVQDLARLAGLNNQD